MVVDVIVGGAGQQGPKGDPGKSAYEIAVDNGFVGTESEWLASLQGEPGADGVDGTDGKSAYQSWLDQGNTGSEQDFIDSLKGEKGDAGDNGADGERGADGADGKSAYEVALDNGFVGTEGEWLDSLVGPQGEQGIQGIQGEKGDPGTTDYDELINKPDLGTAAFEDSSSFATAAQGAKADTAVQSAQEGGVGVLVSNIIRVTQAQYDGLTPQAGTFYVIVG